MRYKAKIRALILQLSSTKGSFPFSEVGGKCNINIRFIDRHVYKVFLQDLTFGI